MNLKQLEAFVQVSESGSFSKAAKELFLTQPTISAHISSLEKELNVRLFIRNTKEVSLSDDGKDLYRYAKQITDLEKAIEERFYMDSDDGKHFITIAASTIPAQYLLPKVLMCYRERYPKEQIKIMETDSSEVVTQVVREEGSGTRKEAEKQLKNAGISMEDLDIVASIANQETIKKSVKQGMGITVLSRLAAEDEDGLLIFPIPGADEGRDINLVYNKNYQMTRSADRFIRIVKEVYDIE